MSPVAPDYITGSGPLAAVRAESGKPTNLRRRTGSFVCRIARQVVGGFEPRDPALGPDMQARLYRGRIIERGDPDIDQARIVDRLPGQRRAASAAKAADRLCRGVVGDGIARGDGKPAARHGQPCDNRGAMRASAYFAMAIECLD